MTKHIKHAVSFIIRHPEVADSFLVVQRPADDENLPNVWGLPAGTMHEGEAEDDCIRRSLGEKLGVVGEPVRLIGEDALEREKYLLHMRDHEVRITSGEPSVPQPHPEVTQYQDWRWGNADDLLEAARKGSLCTRVYLKSIGRSWE